MTITARRVRRAAQRGQNVVEFAIVLVLILVVGALSFDCAAYAVARVELASAVSNATTSTLGVPLGSSQQSAQRYAQDAYNGTLRGQAFLHPEGVTCSSDTYFSGRRSTQGTIRCTGRATIKLSAVLIVPLGPDITIESTSTVPQPPFRQCAQVTNPGDQTC